MFFIRLVCVLVFAIIASLSASGVLPAAAQTLQGGVSTETSRDAVDFCGQMDGHMRPTNYPSEDPKRVWPECGRKAYLTHQCEPPANSADSGDWKILEQDDAYCFLAVPLLPEMRAYLASRILVTAKQIEAWGYTPGCDADPWDPSKFLCKKPSWIAPRGGKTDARGGCADGSNGGGPDSTNFYGCGPFNGAPAGPYIGRTPPTGPVAARGPNAYPRNRVICQATYTRAELDKLSPYGFCEPARETAATPPPPVRPRTGFPTKPTILRSFLRGSTWEFDLSNGQKWTAPATIQAFVQKYGRDYTHGILPQTFDYNYVTGNNVLPHLTYEVFIRGEAFTVQRPATIVTPSEPAPLR